MKLKKGRKADEFRQIKTSVLNRIFLTALTAIAAVGFLLLAYYVVTRRTFFSWMYTIFSKIFPIGYESSLSFFLGLYRVFATVLVILLAFIAVILIFNNYLNWYTAYFRAINKGIGALMKEDGGEIVLPPELSATEKKLTTIQHTLEKRKIDAQLAEQRKNDLVVYLAHDLKTPLTSVIGYLTLLRDEPQISPELREKYLSITLDKAERLENLINEFFEITQFNLSNMTLQYSEVNLTRLLQQLAFEFNPMLAEKGLTCDLQIAQGITLLCDVTKMQRVLDNLLRNAVFYSYADSTIKLTAVQDEAGTRITFQNQGDTIPEEKLKRLFEQFYRLDSARNSNSGGAGLGLAIAKEIVEQHHGTITASSENGCIQFEVALPAFVGKS